MKLFEAQLALHTHSLAEADKADRLAAQWPPDHGDVITVLGIELERNPLTDDYRGQRGDLELQLYRRGSSRTRPLWHLRLRRGGAVAYCDEGTAVHALCWKLEDVLRNRARKLHRPSKG